MTHTLCPCSSALSRVRAWTGYCFEVCLQNVCPHRTILVGCSGFGGFDLIGGLVGFFPVIPGRVIFSVQRLFSSPFSPVLIVCVGCGRDGSVRLACGRDGSVRLALFAVSLGWFGRISGILVLLWLGLCLVGFLWLSFFVPPLRPLVRISIMDPLVIVPCFGIGRPSISARSISLGIPHWCDIQLSSVRVFAGLLLSLMLRVVVSHTFTHISVYAWFLGFAVVGLPLF